jgi:hypothetical protein
MPRWTLLLAGCLAVALFLAGTARASAPHKRNNALSVDIGAEEVEYSAEEESGAEPATDPAAHIVNMWA